MIEKGFTLIELLVVIVILIIIALVVIATINPIEQLNKAKDGANLSNATNLLDAIERFQASNDGKDPEIQIFSNSYVCGEIIDAGPVTDITSLRYELSSWFPKEIIDKGKELYAGQVSGNVKVCYQIRSINNITLSGEQGCNAGYLYYLCLP